uniref:Serine/arginine repetitive matrix protein 1-like n=1 Tax=Cicer arietinum TaxID=3827 RepID=A0A1S2Z6J6_CICAR|nr:serine/arginine repetitive matrix protein 1-like [Cicer arietinum]
MAYKNPRSSPPSSLSPSPSPSPSPPSRPTPPHSSSEKTFSDYLSSSPEPCPQPLSTKLPPLFQCPTHSFNQCPPHLRNTMNPSSNTSSSNRRSAHNQARIGISKTKKVDTTIYTISDDDSEPSTPQHKPESQATHASQPTKPKSPEILKTQPRKPKSKSPSTLSQFLASQKLKIPKKSQMNTSQERPSPPLQSQERSSPPLQPQERSSPPQERSSPPLQPQKRSSPPPQPQECSSSQLSPQERSSTKQPTKERSPFKTPTQKTKETSTTTNLKSFTKPSSSKILILPLISSKIQNIFSEKWTQCPIGIGRVFNFEKLQIEGISIQHHTDALGWTDFLKISDCHYPQVIRAFYFKAEAFEDKSLIVSTLKGIVIRLAPLILADILKIPSEGLTIFGKDWYTTLNISKEEVFQELFVDGTTKCLLADLKPLPKFFNNIGQHNILPHCGSHEFVYDNDALVIYHLLHCKKLNLPYLIIQHIDCCHKKGL